MARLVVALALGAWTSVSSSNVFESRSQMSRLDAGVSVQTLLTLSRDGGDQSFTAAADGAQDLFLYFDYPPPTEAGLVALNRAITGSTIELPMSLAIEIVDASGAMVATHRGPARVRQVVDFSGDGFGDGLRKAVAFAFSECQLVNGKRYTLRATVLSADDGILESKPMLRIEGRLRMPWN